MGDKKINIQCPSCMKRFDNTTNLMACVCMPCEHLVHDTPECRLCKGMICKICKNMIDDVININHLDKNDQCLIDIVSVVRNRRQFSKWRKFIGFTRTLRTLPMICDLSFRTFMDHCSIPLYCSPDNEWINIKYLEKLNLKVINLLNMHVTIKGEEKLNNNSKCIIICNHSNYHDLLAVGSKYTGMGFVASPAINNFLLGRAITKKYPHVMVENDTTSKILEKDKDKYAEVKKGGYDLIIDFLQKHNKLMICPEGMLSGTNTIVNFRTSAFKCAAELDCDIQPIVIKYMQDIYSLVGSDILNNHRVDVEIIVLDRMKTDGSQESIEKIRQLMAKVGGFQLSRIENRSIQKPTIVLEE
jgi:1-acyl-sn-glycerol-3-phosphate acyltransferase